MSITLSDALKHRDLSYEDFAALLAERGVTLRKGERKGEAYSAVDLQKRSTSALSKAWAEILSIDLEDPDLPHAAGGKGGGARPDDPSGGRRGEQPPRRPANVKPVAPMIESGAQDRIAGFYRGCGAILAMRVAETHGKNTGNGVAEIFDDKADPIASLWIKAAEQSPAIARLVNTINTGGVTGDLILAHVILGSSLIYVLGAPLPDAPFKKYERYRVIVPERPAKPAGASGAAADEPGRNGAAHEPSAAPVGEPPG